jgi:hypothetical protein
MYRENDNESRPVEVQSPTNPADVRPKIRWMEERTRDLPAEQVLVFRYDPSAVFTNARFTAAAMAQPELRAAIERNGFDMEKISNMSLAAEVLLVLCGEKTKEKSAELRADKSRGQLLKRHLVADINHLAAFGLLDEEVSAKFTDTRGTESLGTTLKVGASLLAKQEGKAKLAMLCTKEELVEASLLGEKLVLSANVGSPNANSDAEPKQKTPPLIDRVWTYLCLAQDHAKRAAVVVYGEDWAEHCPPLASREMKRRKAEAQAKPSDQSTATDTQQADSKVETNAEQKPSQTATPASPSAAAQLKSGNGSTGPHIPAAGVGQPSSVQGQQ